MRPAGHRHRSTRLALVTVLAGALLLSVATPARADLESFDDPTDDTSHPADVVRVKLEHDDRVVVVVRHRNLTFTDGPGRVRVAYDTGGTGDQPEFYLRVLYQTDAPIELRVADGWGRLRGGPRAACTGEKARVSAADNWTRIGVPRSCFADPERVRVHVRLKPFPGDKRRVDIAPAARTMGPWADR